MTTTENRVLSVSYGSFSVKLEGFDEPFAIMRRVTEYFRSIAAVDPTFGQKPLIEDLSVLEAIESAVFNDDVSLKTEGSTITLSPKELEVPSDVFILGSTDLAPADEITEAPSADVNEIVEKNAEQQAALVNTPLDLREMAQNHKEMPFVGKGPQALDGTPAEESVQSDDMTAILTQLEAQTPEAPISENIEQEVNTVPKYRSLSLSDFEPASAKAPQADEAADIKATIAALTTTPEPIAQVEEPVAEQETTLIVEESAPTEQTVVEEPVLETPVAEPQSADQAVDLRDQEPVEKSPLRIIRNEYAYEEPEQLKAPTIAPEAPSISVNPFRKFPKREAEVVPAPAAQEPKTEETAAPVDDFVVTYRKLRAEHG